MGHGRLKIIDDQWEASPFMECGFDLNELERNLWKDNYSLSQIRLYKTDSRLYEHLFYYLKLRKDGLENFIIGSFVETVNRYNSQNRAV